MSFIKVARNTRVTLGMRDWPTKKTCLADLSAYLRQQGVGMVNGDKLFVDDEWQYVISDLATVSDKWKRYSLFYTGRVGVTKAGQSVCFFYECKDDAGEEWAQLFSYSKTIEDN